MRSAAVARAEVAGRMTDLDEALERFHCCGLEYAGGRANHGPMAAEALCALGHPALLTGWVDLYAPRLPPRRPGRVLAPAEWLGALGRAERSEDWIATFEARVASESWRSVVRASLPVLAPGLFAGAGHGLLRVAHALRALEAETTTVRVRELAFGLAYWAGRFQRLPGHPGSASERTPADVLRTLAPLPASARRPGLLFEAVSALADHPPFATAVAAADLDGADASACVSGLCEEAARLYLAHPDRRIAYVHAVTLPSALRMILPFADAQTSRALVGYVFQAAAALHSISGDAGAAPSAPSDEVARMAGDPAETRYRAACSLREHAIKMAEACLREDSIAPSPSLRLAAADAAVEIADAGAGLC